MPRNIHKANDRPAGPRPVGETEVDRDAARLLFLEAIRVNSRQLPDQRGLAVIDVPSGADDHEPAPSIALGLASRRR